MKTVLILALLASAPAFAGTTHVKGHVRQDGTYVQPHVRTTPNATKLDNYSTKGNYNPYSGQQGTVDPYKSTQSNLSGSPYNQPRKSQYGY